MNCTPVELLCTIFGFCGRSSLVNLALCCKKFQSIATLILYANIHLKSDASVDITGHMISLASTLEKRTEIAQLTTSIHVEDGRYNPHELQAYMREPSEDFDKLFNDSAQPLKDRLAGYNTWKGSAAFAVLLSRTTNLEVLRVSADLAVDIALEKIAQHYSKQRFERLRRVSYATCHEYAIAPFLGLGALHDLTVESCRILAYDLNLELPEKVPQLRVLVLPECSILEDAPELVCLCPNLNRLVVQFAYIHEDNSHLIFALLCALATHCVQLVSLELTFTRPEEVHADKIFSAPASEGEMSAYRDRLDPESKAYDPFPRLRYFTFGAAKLCCIGVKWLEATDSQIHLIGRTGQKLSGQWRA